MSVNRSWSQEEDRLLREYHAKGYGVHRVARELGRSSKTVREHRKALGLPPLHGGGDRSASINRKRKRVQLPDTIDWGRLAELFDCPPKSCKYCSKQTKFEVCSACRNQRNHRKPAA